jgi:hypothetical protein
MAKFAIRHTIYLNIDQENRIAKIFKQIYGEYHPVTGNVLRDIIMDYCTRMEGIFEGTTPEPLVPQKPEEPVVISKEMQEYLDKEREKMQELLKSVGK